MAKRLFHVLTGEAVFEHDVDVVHALTFPDEWKDRPWSDAEQGAYKRKQQKLTEE